MVPIMFAQGVEIHSVICVLCVLDRNSFVAILRQGGAKNGLFWELRIERERFDLNVRPFRNACVDARSTQREYAAVPSIVARHRCPCRVYQSEQMEEKAIHALADHMMRTANGTQPWQ